MQGHERKKHSNMYLYIQEGHDQLQVDEGAIVNK